MRANLEALVNGREIGAKQQKSYQTPPLLLNRGQRSRRDLDDEDDLVMRKWNSPIMDISLRVTTVSAACILNYSSVFVEAAHSQYHRCLLFRLGQTMTFVSLMDVHWSPVL